MRSEGYGSWVCVCVGFGVYKERRTNTRTQNIYTNTGVWAALVSVTAHNCPGIKIDLTQMPLKPTHLCTYM